MKCTKCGKCERDSEYKDICDNCVDPVVDMDVETLNLCLECNEEPVESDKLCVKCLNAATRESEMYEEQVRNDYYDGLKGL